MTNLTLILTLLLSHISIAIQKPNTRILGGRECKAEEFPSAVVITSIGGRLICGGVILDMRHVVTAAHCHFLSPEEYVVIAGDPPGMNSPSALSKQPREVILVAMHPDFNSTTNKNDIAIFLLNKALEANSHVAMARFMTLESPKIGDKVIVVGWGETETDDYSHHCLATELIIFNKENCTMYLSRIRKKHRAFESDRETVTLDESQICAGDLNGKNSSGYGDSGGPIYMLDGPNMELVGVVSYGDEEVPNVEVETDIAYYRKWILETMKTQEDDHSKLENSELKPSIRRVRNAANQWKNLNNMVFFIFQIVTLRTHKLM